MDYEICFLVCGNRASALGLQKAVGCFLCEESELFCFCGRAHARARACRSHGDTRAGRAGHTLGFVSALLSQISSHITKAIKARKVGGFFMVLRKIVILSILTFRRFSFVHMAIFVAFHLGEPQDGVLTLGAVVVGLLPIVGASPYRTKLRGSVFFEAGGHDGVQLLVLASVGHHFVGIRAIVVAFQTMEVTA